MKKLANKILDIIRPQRQPLSTKNVIRLLVVLLIIASLVAGYFYTKYHDLQKEYSLLENTKLDLIELPTQEAK